MNEKKGLKPVIGILCIILVLLAAMVAVFLDSQSPDPILGIFDAETTAATEATQPSNAQSSTPSEGESTDTPTDGATEPSAETQCSASDEILTPPEEPPASVVIPPVTHPQTGEELGISFPCQVPGYGLVIEKIAPYSGMFVEDGTNATTQNVAMLLVTNDGDFPVEYTQIRVMWEGEELLFDISALPAGESLVVQEKTGKALTDGDAASASALVVQRANMEMSEGKIKVTDNGDNTLTVQNLTDATIPTVRIFYKYYMEEEGLFVGGIAFTVRITRLGAGANVTIQPAHYTSQTSRVVMVLTYASEV